MIAAYVDELSDLPEHAVIEACRRWPKRSNGAWWPAPAELRQVADDVLCEERMRGRPAIEKLRESYSERPSVMSPTIRDPARMRATIANMKANPGRYVAAQHLIAIGELMLERWEQAQQHQRAAE